MKKISLTILFTVVLVVLLFSLWFINFKAKEVQKENINESLIKPIGTLIVLDAYDGKVNVENDEIFIEPFEKASDSSNSESFTITKEKHPELFSKDKGVHFISAEIEGQNLKLINNVHDHGGYSNYYSLTVNLQEEI